MTEQLKEIGGRLSALREIEDLTKERFAVKCGVSVELLEEYESGERDFSFSFLYNAANILGVDVVDLMSGDSPKLSACCLTRAGEGYAIDRRAAYSYRHLAFTFKKKLAEPFMVTVDPSAAADGGVTPPELHAHGGQEFNLLVSGRMRFFLETLVYDLNEGDSIYFDASRPHAMRALDGKPARFLAVVMQGGG
ncbi:MAG: XRE family transcriptional regulator [Oscillospiraceae bacterium]|nr:XRE family transcriptional regulator [Oscillospiraceae bacterium]